MMKFIADEMLGKLARWLRMSGVDVAYQNKIENDEIITICQNEFRILLTRDQKFKDKLPNNQILFIKFDYLHDQTKQFYQKFPEMLKIQNPLSRCVECNQTLKSVDKEIIKDKVWPYVYKTQQHFRICPSCHRIYWEGSHVEKIKERLKLLKPLT